jgi:hypothetical protein
MRVDAKETFTESDKDGNMQNGIGSQLVKLNPVDEEQTAEELMERNREATEEKVNKCYPEVNGRARSALITREDDGVLGEEAELLQHSLVLGRGLQALPSRDLGLLHGCVGVRSAGCSALGAGHAVGNGRKRK